MIYNEVIILIGTFLRIDVLIFELHSIAPDIYFWCSLHVYFYAIHINVQATPGGVSFEYLRILPRCRAQRKFTKRVHKDAGRRMTTGFGPWKFFISQWPEVPEQLFRLLLLTFCSSLLLDIFVSLLRALFLARSWRFRECLFAVCRELRRAWPFSVYPPSLSLM